MKKILIATSVLLIVVILMGAWWYLFKHGKPANTSEIFANFGFGDNAQVEPNTSGGEVTGNSQQETPRTIQRLRQLTTRPVAGAGFAGGVIRYVEQGTGHVYEINPTDLSESLLRSTTIAQASHAVFSPSAEVVAITPLTGNRTTLESLLNGEGGSSSSITLPDGAQDIAFSVDGAQVFYRIQKPTGSLGYAYSLASGVNTLLFEIPLRDVRVVWGKEIYVYTTPTSQYEGYIYKIKNKNISHITGGGFGLVGAPYSQGVLVTKRDENIWKFESISHSNTATQQLVPLIPEKCTPRPQTDTSVLCAVPNDFGVSQFPDGWYTGEHSYTDTLWDIDASTGNSATLIDLFREGGRQIDVHKIGADALGQKIWFINKIDNTLWMFDTTL